MELRKYRIDLAQARDRRAIRHIRAGIAGRFQLPGAIDAFEERRLLIRADRSAGRRMRTDQRRMRNRDATVLQVTCGIVQTAPHAWVGLRESGCCREKKKHSGDASYPDHEMPPKSYRCPCFLMFATEGKGGRCSRPQISQLGLKIIAVPRHPKNTRIETLTRRHSPHNTRE